MDVTRACGRTTALTRACEVARGPRYGRISRCRGNAALALEIADDLGDASLQSSARDALGVAAFRRGDFDAAYEFETSRFRLRDELDDPDLVHDLYLSTIPTANAVGRLGEARRLGDELVEIVAE